MLCKNKIALLLILLLSSPCLFARVARTAQDSLAITPAGREQRFYDSIESKTSRNGFSRMLYNIMFRDEVEDYGDKIVDASRKYDDFAGKKINIITVITGDVFERPGNLLERAANTTHVITRERVVKRDLLFREGDLLDPEMIARNISVLLSRRYIYSVNIDVAPNFLDPTMVDVIVRTTDSWSLSADGSFSGNGRTSIKLYDENIAGSGNLLSIETSFDWKDESYGGNLLEYKIPNILGTFFQADLIAGKRFDNSDLGVSVYKNLILPTDYEIGAKYEDKRQPHYIISEDSTVNSEHRMVDLWGGRSLYIKELKSSLFLVGRFIDKRFDDRPDVGLALNPAFHDYSQALLVLGLYREKFYSANMIYGFGVREYLAAGYKLETVGGYRWGEFTNDWYLGMNYRLGGFPRQHFYIMGSLSLGSYIDHATGHWNRSAMAVDLKFFSPLFRKGRVRIRQFIDMNYVRGWNREAGADEMLNFTDLSGPRGFNEYVLGQNRAVINTETVVFTPFKPYGFRTALFGYADFGLIGDERNVFKNEFFTTFGVGVRFKNERLIFNTIQIRLGICVGKAGFMNNKYLNVSNQSHLTQYRYIPQKPEVVGYE